MCRRRVSLRAGALLLAGRLEGTVAGSGLELDGFKEGDCCL